MIDAPWAVDASGKRLPTFYSVNGDVITQHVVTTAARYPIVADPYFRWYWDGVVITLTYEDQIALADGGTSLSGILAASGVGLAGLKLSGRGGAFGDFDNDGDLDVAVVNMDDRPLLLRNEGGHKAGHWLQIKAVGTKSNRDAIGAWIMVRVAGERLWRQVMPTRSYLSQSELPVTVGLGTAAKPNTLQQAFIDEQAAQCGYCIAGMVMRAQALLDRNPAPSEAEIRAQMEPNLCRCGTHMRILRAIRRASEALRRNPPAAGREARR